MDRGASGRGMGLQLDAYSGGGGGGRGERLWSDINGAVKAARTQLCPEAYA